MGRSSIPSEQPPPADLTGHFTPRVPGSEAVTDQCVSPAHGAVCTSHIPVERSARKRPPRSYRALHRRVCPCGWDVHRGVWKRCDRALCPSFGGAYPYASGETEQPPCPKATRPLKSALQQAAGSNEEKQFFSWARQLLGCEILNLRQRFETDPDYRRAGFARTASKPGKRKPYVQPWVVKIRILQNGEVLRREHPVGRALVDLPYEVGRRPSRSVVRRAYYRGRDIVIGFQRPVLREEPVRLIDRDLTRPPSIY